MVLAPNGVNIFNISLPWTQCTRTRSQGIPRFVFRQHSLLMLHVRTERTRVQTVWYRRPHTCVQGVVATTRNNNLIEVFAITVHWTVNISDRTWLHLELMLSTENMVDPASVIWWSSVSVGRSLKDGVGSTSPWTADAFGRFRRD